MVQEIDDELAHPTQKCDTTSTHCSDKQSSQSRQTPSSPSNINSSGTPRSCSRSTNFLSAMGLQTRSHHNINNNNNNTNNSKHKNIEHLMAVRAKCVEELLNTEKDYVTMLKNIIEVCNVCKVFMRIQKLCDGVLWIPLYSLILLTLQLYRRGLRMLFKACYYFVCFWLDLSLI